MDSDGVALQYPQALKGEVVGAQAAIPGGEANEAVVLLLPVNVSLRYCMDSSNALRRFVQLPELSEIREASSG